MDDIPIAALRQVLERDLHAPVGELTARRISGGNGQETWFVDAEVAGETRPLVLRRDPPAGSMEFTERATEFEVLRSMEGSGLPVPRAFACGDADAGLDRPYLLMERLGGAPPRGLDPDERAAIGHELGALLGRFHAHSLAQGGERGTAADATRAHVSEWRARYRERHVGELPMLDALFGWLEANVPDSTRPAIQLWGDPGPHNLLVADGRVTAMLDWELAHHGDPADDLGAAVWACLGTLDPDDVIEGYRSTSPFDVPAADLDHAVVLACVTRSTISGIGALAYAEGRTETPNLAGLALALTTANLARAAVHAGWGRLPEPDGGSTSLAPGGLDPFRPRPDAAELAGGVARFLDQRSGAEQLDRDLRRDLRIAAALLRTSARLDGGAPSPLAAELDALRDEVAATTGRDDLSPAEVAWSIERDDELIPLRPRLRDALLRDVAHRRSLLQPLAELYGPLVDVPRQTPYSEDAP